MNRLCSTKSIAKCYILSLASITPQDSSIAEFSGQCPVSSVAQLDLPRDMPLDLQKLLLQYRKVFALSSGLPPSRVYDHSIPLISEASLVKVKLYRYPHSQKSEIELMVKETLQEGLIEPSTSPFSSPVLLVRKKDGSWRFCTDYRALNAITIKDAYPIPTVDELLDELCGAQFFFKIGPQVWISSNPGET